MIITHLYLLNYKQFLQLDLTFREGLVGIIGKNGAGKSTLFDAIIYCLFGKDEDEKQYIRNTSAPEKSTVTLALTFQIEEQLYRIKREFRGKDLVANAELYKNEVQIAKGLSEVNRQIIKLLNMEREAFKKSAFSGQKEISELADATREDRKKLIRKMMGLERLDIIRKKINEEKNILDNEVKMIIALLSDEKMLQDKQEVLLHTTNEIDRLINIKLTQEKALEQTKILSENNKNNFAAEEKNKIKFDTHFGNIEKFQSKIAEIEKGIANSTIQIENLIKLQHELKNIAPTIALFEKNQATLIAQQTAFTSFKNKEELLATQQLILDDLQKLDTKIQLLIEQVNIKQVLLQKIDNQQYTVNEYFEDEEKTRLELSMQVQQRGAIEGKILDIEHKLQQIKLLEENSDCPTCFRPLLEQYNVVVEHLSHELNISQTSALTTVNQMIEKYNQTIKTLVQKRNDAEKLLKESLNKLATIQSQENQLLIELEQQKILQQRHTEVTSRIAALRVENFDLDAFQMLKSEVENYQPQYLDYIKKEGQVETLPELLKTREEANLRLVNGQKCVEQEIATLSDLQFDIEKFNRLKTEKELLHQQVLEQTTILNTTFIALKDVENQQLNIKNEIEQHNKHLKVIQEKKSEIGLLGQLLQVFDGFKIEILERVSPSISTYAGQLFNRITNGKYENILVDEDFRFHITDNGIEYPIARYSGGEQDLANLCLRIAVTQTIGEMNGNQSAINFLAFDEILGSQDEERRNEILTAFNTLRHDFKQIYIISHIETIREYFEHILEVSESPKGSVVRWI